MIRGFLYRWAPGTLESTDGIAGREPGQADLCSYRIQILCDETLLTVVLRRLLGAALYISVYVAKGVTLTAGRGSHMQRACCVWYELYAEGRTAARAVYEVKAVKPWVWPTVLLDQRLMETVGVFALRLEGCGFFLKTIKMVPNASQLGFQYLGLDKGG